MVQDILRVSLHKNSPCVIWRAEASNLPENTLVHFSLHYNNSFGQVFEFPERNTLLGTYRWQAI